MNEDTIQTEETGIDYAQMMGIPNPARVGKLAARLPELENWDTPKGMERLVDVVGKADRGEPVDPQYTPEKIADFRKAIVLNDYLLKRKLERRKEKYLSSIKELAKIDPDDMTDAQAQAEIGMKFSVLGQPSKGRPFLQVASEDFNLDASDYRGLVKTLRDRKPLHLPPDEVAQKAIDDWFAMTPEQQADKAKDSVESEIAFSHGLATIPGVGNFSKRREPSSQEIETRRAQMEQEILSKDYMHGIRRAQVYFAFDPESARIGAVMGLFSGKYRDIDAFANKLAGMTLEQRAVALDVARCYNPAFDTGTWEKLKRSSSEMWADRWESLKKVAKDINDPETEVFRHVVAGGGMDKFFDVSGIAKPGYLPTVDTEGRQIYVRMRPEAAQAVNSEVYAGMLGKGGTGRWAGTVKPQDPVDILTRKYVDGEYIERKAKAVYDVMQATGTTFKYDGLMEEAFVKGMVVFQDMAPTAAAFMASPITGGASGAAAWAEMYARMAGDMSRDLEYGAGLTREQAATVGFLAAVPQAAIERMQMGPIFRWTGIAAMAKENPLFEGAVKQSVRRAFLWNLRENVKEKATETATEIIEESMQSAVGEVAKNLSDLYGYDHYNLHDSLAQWWADTKDAAISMPGALAPGAVFNAGKAYKDTRTYAKLNASEYTLGALSHKMERMQRDGVDIQPLAVGEWSTLKTKQERTDFLAKYGMDKVPDAERMMDETAEVAKRYNEARADAIRKAITGEAEELAQANEEPVGTASAPAADVFEQARVAARKLGVEDSTIFVNDPGQIQDTKIRDRIRSLTEKGEDVSGLIDDATGKKYIIAGDSHTATQKLLHEYAHELHSLFANDATFQRQMQEAIGMMGGREFVQNILMGVSPEYGKLSGDAAVMDEAFARLAERVMLKEVLPQRDRTAWEKLKDAVRNVVDFSENKESSEDMAIAQMVKTMFSAGGKAKQAAKAITPLAKVLNDALPQLKDAAQADGYDILPEVQSALARFVEMRTDGVTVGEYLSKQRESVNPLEERVLRLLDENSASPVFLGQVFARYADLVKAIPKPGENATEKQPTRDSLLDIAVDENIHFSAAAIDDFTKAETDGPSTDWDATLNQAREEGDSESIAGIIRNLANERRLSELPDEWLANASEYLEEGDAQTARAIDTELRKRQYSAEDGSADNGRKRLKDHFLSKKKYFLPSPSILKKTNAPFAGELLDLYKDLPMKERMTIFRKQEVNLDNLRASINEEGFNFKTIDEMLDALANDLSGQIPKYQWEDGVPEELYKAGTRWSTATAALSTPAQEYADVENMYKGTDKWLKAPNGKDTKLTERQWIQVRTPSFKRWFGDWEHDPYDSSQFLDINGEPKVFYHRSPNEFSVFDAKRIGTGTDSGWLGRGFYFYGDLSESNGPGSGYGKNQYGVFLNGRNLYYPESNEVERLASKNNKRASQEFTVRLTEEDYDAVYWNGDLREEAVVFSPAQIKSATDNTGAFDAGNPDIRYSTNSRNQDIGKPFAEVFKNIPADPTAKMPEAVEGKPDFEATVSAVEAFLKKNARVVAPDGVKVRLNIPDRPRSQKDGNRNLRNRAIHLITYSDGKSIDTEKARWIYKINETIQNAQARFSNEYGARKSLIYVRNYGGVIHAVVLGKDGELQAHLITQFPILQKRPQAFLQGAVMDAAFNASGHSRGLLPNEQGKNPRKGQRGSPLPSRFGTNLGDVLGSSQAGNSQRLSTQQRLSRTREMVVKFAIDILQGEAITIAKVEKKLPHAPGSVVSDVLARAQKVALLAKTTASKKQLSTWKGPDIIRTVRRAEIGDFYRTAQERIQRDWESNPRRIAAVVARVKESMLASRRRDIMGAAQGISLEKLKAAGVNVVDEVLNLDAEDPQLRRKREEAENAALLASNLTPEQLAELEKQADALDADFGAPGNPKEADPEFDPGRAKRLKPAELLEKLKKEAVKEAKRLGITGAIEQRAEVRATYKRALEQAAHKLVYGQEREHILDRIDELDNYVGEEALDKAALRVIERIYERSNLDSRHVAIMGILSILKKVKKPVRTTADHSRRIAADVETYLYHAKRALGVSLDAVQENMEKLSEAVKQAQNEGDTAKQLDLEIEAQAMEDFGGLFGKTRIEVIELRDKLENDIPKEVEAHRARVEERAAKINQAADVLVKTFAKAKTKTQQKGIVATVGSLMDLGMPIGNRLRDLIAHAKADSPEYKAARSLVDEIEQKLQRADMRKRVEIGQGEKWMMDTLGEIYGENAHDALKELTKLRDEYRKYSNSDQPMNKSQLMQLIASMEQEFYHENALLHRAVSAEEVAQRRAKVDAEAAKASPEQMRKALTADIDALDKRERRWRTRLIDQMDEIALRRKYADKLWRQDVAPDLEKALEKRMKAMRAELSERDFRLLDALRKWYKDARPRLSETQKAITGYGIIQPEPNYMPVKLELYKAKGETTLAVPLVQSVFKERRHSQHDFDETFGAVEMFWGRIAEIAHFNNFARLQAQYRPVFESKILAKTAEQKYGKDAYGALTSHLTDIWAVRPLSLSNPGAKGWQTINSLMGMLAMGWNLSVMFSQISSLPAFMLYKHPAATLGIMQDKGDIGFVDALREIWKSDVFKERVGKGNTQILNEILADRDRGKVWRAIKKSSFAPIIGGDAFNILVLGANLYRVKLADNIRQGMAEPAAKETALSDMMSTLELTQQSGSVLNMAEWQRRGGEFGKAVGMFTTQPMLFLAYEAEALKFAMKQNTSEAWLHAARIFFVNHVILPGAFTLTKILFNWALGDEPDKEDIGWMAANMIIGPFSGLYLAGFFIAGAAEGLTSGNKLGGEAIPALTLVQLARYSGGAMHDIFANPSKLSADIDRILKSANAPYRHVRKALSNYGD